MSECKIWQGQTSGGYGIANGHTAHRTAWEKVNGKLPEGMLVHHVCDNKLCVNPHHLVAVTFEEHRSMHPRITRATKPHRVHLYPKRYLCSKDDIEQAMTKHTNIIARAARSLNISRTAFYDYLKRYNIPY